MASLTINPTSTVTLGGGTVVSIVGSSPTADEVLADPSNGTYVALDGLHTGIGFTPPSILAGSKINAIVASTVVAVVNPSDPTPTPRTLRNNLIGIPGTQDVSVSWSTPLTSLTYVSSDPDANAGVTAWEFDLKNQTGAGAFTELRVYKLQLVISYVPRPVVTVSNPTGTITNTSFPLAVWDWTSDDDGGDVNRAEVRIFKESQYTAGGFSPGGTTPFAGSGILDNESGGSIHQWRTTTKLPNDYYRAYVRVRQFDKSDWSAWAFHTTTTHSGSAYSFRVDVIPPDDPSSITVTPEESQGRMLIDVVGTEAPPTHPTVDAMDIERSIDGGTSWTALRPFGQVSEGIGISPVSGEVVAWDWEAPIGSEVLYRARALHAYALGEWASSNWVVSDPATLDANSWWLKHPTDWTLDSSVFVRSQASSIRAARQGIFTPLGRRDAVVVSDVRIAASGEITLRTMDDAELEQIEDLVGTEVPLLIQAPPDNAWPDRWVTLGDMTYERVVDGFSRPWLFLNLTWQEVIRPEGSLEFLPAGGPTHLTLPFTIGDTLS